MANGLYKPYKSAAMSGGANTDLLTGDVKAVLVDAADYTVDLDNHDFLADIAAGARVATSGNLASKTFASNAFDAADFSFTTVSGDPSEALVYYIDTGVEATSRLVLYVDTATGLPITPNGGNIDVTHNASGIFLT
ncbi:MAG: hypothetical protein ACR2RA_18965 [Geminicoccaceae bacterium]